MLIIVTKSRYCQPNMFRGCSGRGSTSSSVSTVSGIDCKHVCQVQHTVSPSIIQERNACLRSPFPSHKHKPVSLSSVFSTLYKLYSFPAANYRYPDHSCRRGCCYRNSGTQGRQTGRCHLDYCRKKHGSPFKIKAGSIAKETQN